jgi:hypothetical protein
MMIAQDDFNKLVTITLMLYCMGMFAVSWYTGKQLDLNGFLILLAPILTHLGHVVTDMPREVASIKADASKQIAVTVQKSNGGTNHP